MLNNQGRKKIWQIDTGYHCAIMGTCFGRVDLRRLKRKKVFGLPASASDYQVHNVFAGTGDVKSQQARVLQKVLDEKYAAFIRRYAEAQNDEELWEKWQEDSNQDKAPGAFWAIMTHPEASSDLLGRVYGECHMISFDTFSQQRSSSTAIKQLEQRVEQEQRKNAQLVDRVKKEQEKSVRLRKAEREEKAAMQKVKGELLRLQQEKDTLTSQLLQGGWQELEKLKIAHEKALEENCRLQKELIAARNEATKYRSDIEVAQMQAESLVNFADMRFAQQECSMGDNCLGGREPCDTCEDCGTDACMGRNLCGKMVLYVGGRSNMVHLYRQVVVERGGKFSHHDGGRENSRQQLPRLLSGADVVLCPVDCVSHDACKQVKRICKRYHKPFVMMRSSGVSALEKQLESVA